MIKYRNDVGDLKEEFWQSYTGFARKLKEVGYENECYAYMDICVMYYHLMDCPDELLAHKEFFADLYESLRICCTQGLTILRIMRKNMMSIVSVSENLATISILKLQF